METKENMDTIARKISKLLALSKSPNEAEASAAAAKAHDLLMRYNLSMTDVLGADGQRPYVGKHGYGDWQTRPKQWRQVLMQEIAQGNLCALITEHAGQYFRYSIVGREHNVAAVKVMTDYLFSAVERISREECSARTKQRYRESFRLGMAIAIARKLQSLRRLEQSGDECRALVVTEQKDIEDFMDGLENLKRSKTTINTGNMQALMRGHRCGEQVGLHKQVAGGAV